MCSASRFMATIDARHAMLEESEYSLAITAIVHDVGHLGAIDQFLVEPSQELAAGYDPWFPMDALRWC